MTDLPERWTICGNRSARALRSIAVWRRSHSPLAARARRRRGCAAAAGRDGRQAGKRTVVDYDEYVGRFVAVESVEVRARVSGYLEKVHFKDGQIVKQGDLLFTIDKRPFQNALDAGARQRSRRRARIWPSPTADLERALATGARQDHHRADLRAAHAGQAHRARRRSRAQEAAVRQAELDLRIHRTEARRSTGRIGDRRVSPGNLVTGGTGGNTTLLATIVSTDPIRFEFTFDEASYLRYERLASDGQGRRQPRRRRAGRRSS